MWQFEIGAMDEIMGMDMLSRDGGIESKWGKLEEEFEVDGAVFWAGEEYNLLDLDGIMLFWIRNVMRWTESGGARRC